MNTTFYWRGNTSSVLSKEFFELCKEHLKNDEVIYLNTTSASDVVYTLAHVFNHVSTFKNFVAASNQPFDLDLDQRKNNLLLFEVNNSHTSIDNSEEHNKLLEKILAAPTA